ncbi:MAG TPA: deoxynucleoside kinase [Burkholderiaceae bacterium]
MTTHPTLTRLRHIAIEGPIGVGKTSLARRLGQRLGARLLLEQPEANPFLERFYRDRARFALPTQLVFLFQRVQQLGELAQLDLFRSQVVADFMLEKDALFARLTLADDEFRLYQAIHDRLAPQAPPPDLVVYLQARPETLLGRVAQRANPIEDGITEAYLRSLSEAYALFFHHFDGAPVLIVNSEHLNLAERDDDFELLLDRIDRMRGRREVFSVGA